METEITKVKWSDEYAEGQDPRIRLTQQRRPWETPNGEQLFVEPQPGWDWSGSYSVPEKGDRVRIQFNNLGSGKVVGFFKTHKSNSRDGRDRYPALGLVIALDNPPAWHTQQCAGTWSEGLATVLGSETEFLEAWNRCGGCPERIVPNPDALPVEDAWVHKVSGGLYSRTPDHHYARPGWRATASMEGAR